MAKVTILALFFLCYAAPWAEAGSPGLHVNAYDWAEWLSLHPVERSAEPPLLISLALRLHLLGLTVLLACIIPSSWRWSYATSLSMLVVAQLPPLEFLSNMQDNNYKQQAFLAVFALFLSLLARTADHKWRNNLILGIAVLGCGLLFISLPQALVLTRLYYAQLDLTAAPIAFAALYLGCAALAWKHKRSLATAPLTLERT